MKNEFMKRAVSLARKNLKTGNGGPFGCVIVKNNQIIGEGWNRVIEENDPTSHAEMNAIRNACKNLNSFQLDGCEIYTSSEPCPMCLGAIYWARPLKVYFAANRQEAANIGFDDEYIYQEFELPLPKRQIKLEQIKDEEMNEIFEEWKKKSNKATY